MATRGDRSAATGKERERDPTEAGRRKRTESDEVFFLCFFENKSGAQAVWAIPYTHAWQAVCLGPSLCLCVSLGWGFGLRSANPLPPCLPGSNASYIFVRLVIVGSNIE
jgi:hypothetical protein